MREVELLLGSKYTVKVDDCLTFRGVLASSENARLEFLLKCGKRVYIRKDRCKFIRKWK